MTTHRRERMYRFCVALAFLYGLLAMRYLAIEGDPSQSSYLQALALGWCFAVTSVVASVVPARPRPPHLRD